MTVSLASGSRNWCRISWTSPGELSDTSRIPQLHGQRSEAVGGADDLDQQIEGLAQHGDDVAVAAHVAEGPERAHGHGRDRARAQRVVILGREVVEHERELDEVRAQRVEYLGRGVVERSRRVTGWVQPCSL